VTGTGAQLSCPGAQVGLANASGIENNRFKGFLWGKANFQI